jgi:hypothetical protein
MRNIRALFLSFLIVAGACLLSGCATTSNDSNATINNSSAAENNPLKPTEDMNAIQKSACYVAWFALAVAYGLGGGNAPLLPP